ncbi:MAG TPA: hypothetical protein VIG08_06075 [Gemmatimonadales bacterium]|jgi:hypothetical protein
MRITPLLSHLGLVAIVATVVSCSDSSGPGPGDTKDQGELTIVRLADTSPPLLNPVDSFYAKRGEDREIRIFFADVEGKQGEEYLRLRINAQSLLARPDGSLFQEGDSILVHVRVVDPAELLFEMQPSGLRFSPSEPAELKIHYDHANEDFNDDGKVNQDDDSIETTLGIWRQETLTDPFVRLGSAVVKDLKEIEAELEGFSRYALAY